MGLLHYTNLLAPKTVCVGHKPWTLVRAKCRASRLLGPASDSKTGIRTQIFLVLSLGILALHYN